METPKCYMSKVRGWADRPHLWLAARVHGSCRNGRSESETQKQGYRFGGPYNQRYSILGSILGPTSCFLCRGTFLPSLLFNINRRDQLAARGTIFHLLAMRGQRLRAFGLLYY